MIRLKYSELNWIMSAMSPRICILILVAALLSVETRRLPNYLQKWRCSLKNDLKSCFIKNGNMVLPLIAKGDADFKIQKFDPMDIQFVQLISSPTLKLNLTNLKVYGLEKMKIVDGILNLPQGIITTILEGNNVTIKGQYSVDGQLLVLPIRGSGHFSLYLKDGVYTSTLLVKIIEKNGLKYLKAIGNQLNYHFKKVQFQLDNLFDGNEKLGDEMNRFLNENWEILLVDFGPGIARTISDIHRKNFDDFNTDLPINELFSE